MHKRLLRVVCVCVCGFEFPARQLCANTSFCAPAASQCCAAKPSRACELPFEGVRCLGLVSLPSPIQAAAIPN